MLVKALKLKNVRIHAEFETEFMTGGAVFVGKNGTGKSSILEALHCAAVCRSFRRIPDEQLVKKGTQHLEVVAEIDWADESHSVEFRVALGEGKRVYYDGRRLQRMGELVETTAVVTTTSEDMLIVEGSPAYARRWMNLFVCQQEKGHLARLQRYQQILRQRNVLLAKGKQTGEAVTRRELGPWTEQLFELAVEIEEKRLSIIEEVSSLVPNLYAGFVGTERKVEIRYRPGLKTGFELNRVFEMFGQEVSRGHTLWGPHRAGLDIKLDGLAANDYASRGEKRSIAFAIKMSQAMLMRQRPMCLIDDLSLELDENRSREVLRQFMGLGQVVATSARIDKEWPSGLAVIQLRDSMTATRTRE